MKFEESRFFKRFYPLIKEFVENGGDVNDLSNKDALYVAIKSNKILDENGKPMTLERKFKLLGFPRKAKISADVRADLLKEISEYLASGGTFDVPIKTLPFYVKLDTYRRFLRRHGKDLTLDEIMRDDLGFKSFSTLKERCRDLERLDEYDVDGYVDGYRKDRQLSTYVTDLADRLNIPYYLVITLIADKKMTKYVITIDYVQYVKSLLEKYIAKHGNLIGLKRNDVKAYEAFRHLVEGYSDGSGRKFTSKEWIEMFGLSGFANRFKENDALNVEIDLSSRMHELKEKFGEKQIVLSDVDPKLYADVLKYSRKYAITVKEVFARFGVNYKGITIQRLNHATMSEIPYFEEMKALRDQIILDSEISIENGNSAEEVFEVKVRAVQQAYAVYADRIMLIAEDVDNITEDIIID